MTSVNQAFTKLINGETLKFDMGNGYAHAKLNGSIGIVSHHSENGRLIEARSARNFHALEKYMRDIAEISDWQLDEDKDTHHDERYW